MFERIAGQQPIHGRTKELGQGKVDGPHGAVKVEAAKQFAAGLQEMHECGQALGVERQPPGREKAVVEQPVQIEGARTVAGHGTVAQHKIHIVHGVNAAEQRAQQAQPDRHFAVRVAGPFDQVGNLLRLQRFVRGQCAVRIGANSPDQLRQVRNNDLSAQVFMGQIVLIEKMVIEEMPERPVADIVEQGSKAQQAFDVGPRRNLFSAARLAERRIQMSSRSTGQVHRAQHVLKARMFGRGIDPPGALQLMNLAEPLHPGMIDEGLLGDLARITSGRKRDVAVHRVAEQTLAVIGSQRHGGTFQV